MIYNPVYIDEGKRAFAYFHNACLSYSDYTFSFPDLVEYVENLKPSFFHFYGKAILDTDFSHESLLEINTEIADTFDGRLPSYFDLQIFFDAMIEDIQSIKSKFNFMVEAVKDTAKDTAKIGAGLAIAGIGTYALIALVPVFLMLTVKK